jgi:integrase/quercetin dioxygenase-like cupin family protein
MSQNGRPDANPDATPAENARFVAFRASLEAEGLSPVTCACYASDWWNVAERIHGQTRRRFDLAGLTVDEFLAYRADAVARGVSAATGNRRLAFLRKYARFAAAAEASCGPVAAALAGVPFQPLKPLGGRSALSREEEERLMEASARVGAAEHAIVALLMRTGVRVDEIVALLRGDVAGPADSPSSLRVRGGREKTILLPPQTSRAVGALLDAHPGEDGDPLVRVRGRFAMTAASVAAAVARCAREAHVRASPRTLRHTFAVRYLAEHGDDVDGLSAALGRASPAILRAWRDEAGIEAAAPKIVRWREIASDPSSASGARALRAGQVDAFRHEVRQGARATLPARPGGQTVFVVAGRIEFRTDSGRAEAKSGDVVVLANGQALAVRSLGPKTAVLLAASAVVRRPV